MSNQQQSLSHGPCGVMRSLCCVLLFYVMYSVVGDSITRCHHDRFLPLHEGVVLASQIYSNAQSPISALFRPVFVENDRTCSSGQQVPLFIGTQSSWDTAKGEIFDFPNCTSLLISNCLHKCTENDIPTILFQNQITSAMATVSTKIKRMLLVKRIQSNLIIPTMQCGILRGVPISPSIATSWLSSPDILIFITSRPISDSAISSYSASCLIDQNGRPIVGHINISPRAWVQNDRSESWLTAVMLHEALHVLGFSSLTMTNYGASRPPSFISKVIQGQTYFDWIDPVITKEAQNQFDCSNILEVSWEDSAGFQSHWDQFTFRGELMAPSFNPSSVITTMTLSFFSQSGWYNVDAKEADVNEFGKSLGCGFYFNCKSRLGDGYFCTKNQTQGCTYDYRSKGACWLTQYPENLLPVHQYFTNPKIGGESMLENYCPLYRPLINCNSFSPLDSLNGEETGPNSACFMSTITQNTSNSIPSNVDMAPMCYHAVCTQPNVIKIRILDYWYTCYDGEEKAIYPTGFSGSIQCPRSVRSFCVKRFLGSYMKVVLSSMVIFEYFQHMMRTSIE
eukprot:TRINITY_DN6177_c0_g1_i28.p1 TRINITY_DN6177_c0_g1~~TRINITY_DN6177_c0_g1_i28.p1  ORF type:complete len:565 (+),score=50.37 TRINITY_DN6177_c0_g1_i28:61-1755(+)